MRARWYWISCHMRAYVLPRWPRAWRNPATLGLHEAAWGGYAITKKDAGPEATICQFMLFGLLAAVIAKPLLMPVIAARALHIRSIKPSFDHRMRPRRCGDGVCLGRARRLRADDFSGRSNPHAVPEKLSSSPPVVRLTGGQRDNLFQRAVELWFAGLRVTAAPSPLRCILAACKRPALNHQFAAVTRILPIPSVCCNSSFLCPGTPTTCQAAVFFNSVKRPFAV